MTVTTRYKVGPRIAVFGDSVSKVVVDTHTQRWPNLVAAAFYALGYRPSLWNWAVSGAASSYFGNVYRTTITQANCNKYKPEIVLIELGTNDLQGLGGSAALTSYLGYIAADAKSANPTARLIMCSCVRKYGDATYDANLAEYNSAIEAAATAAGAVYADIYNAYTGSAGDEATYCADGIHPSVAGHIKIYDVVWAAITGQSWHTASYGRR